MSKAGIDTASIFGAIGIKETKEAKLPKEVKEVKFPKEAKEAKETKTIKKVSFKADSELWQFVLDYAYTNRLQVAEAADIMLREFKEKHQQEETINRPDSFRKR